MSWRSDRTDRYNRAEENEYWLTLVEEEIYWDCPWMHDWGDTSWSDYSGYYYPGYVATMEELHQMRLLTLLRKLHIREAVEFLKGTDWE